MQSPLELIFTNMQRSDAVETDVRERVERLEKLFNGITSCHVFVDASHLRHRKGNLHEVRIEVRVPGTELAVNKKPGDVNAHEDVHVTVRDAFDAMERQLKKWKQRLRGQPKARESPLQGRIAEIYPNEGYGQIATTDQRLIYFHRNSVVAVGFDQLTKGDTVELVVQYGESEKGPQASTVRPISSLQFIDKPD